MTPMAKTDFITWVITSHCQTGRGKCPKYRTDRLYDPIPGDDDHCHHRKNTGLPRKDGVTVPSAALQLIPFHIEAGTNGTKKTVYCS